jgi:hypothetical protein
MTTYTKAMIPTMLGAVESGLPLLVDGAGGCWHSDQFGDLKQKPIEWRSNGN